MNPFLKAFRWTGWKLGLLKDPVLIKFFEIKAEVKKAVGNKTGFKANEEESKILMGQGCRGILQDFKAEETKEEKEYRNVLGAALAEYMLDKTPPHDKILLADYNNNIRALGSMSIGFVRRAWSRLTQENREEIALDAYAANKSALREVRSFIKECGLKLDPIKLLISMAEAHKPESRDLSALFLEVLKQYYPGGMNKDDQQKLYKALNEAVSEGRIFESRKEALLQGEFSPAKLSGGCDQPRVPNISPSEACGSVSRRGKPATRRRNVRPIRFRR